MPSKKQEIPEADHAGHRERLRERFRLDGLQGFAPHEALELLLTYAIPRINVNPLAHRLIDHFGGLPGVLEAKDMTPEAVAVKLMWALGQTTDRAEAMRLFTTPVEWDIV